MQTKIIVDLGYGDSGKGTMTDFLCREVCADMVVRYSGGAQCGHNVVLPDGTHHEFRMFGAGTLQKIPTYLSQYVLVNPLMVFEEAYELQKKGINESMQYLFVDPECVITTPFHIALNRLKEMARGDKRHGSVGMGIGETMADVLDGIGLQVQDLSNHNKMWAQLKLMQKEKQLWVRHAGLLDKIEQITDSQVVTAIDTLWEEEEVEECYEFFKAFAQMANITDKALKGKDNLVFEGAQGVLLDQDYPHMPMENRTWSKTTGDNARKILANLGREEYEMIGVIRSFMTRHGRGPFQTQDQSLCNQFTDPHNPFNTWQEGFRVGWLNMNEICDAIHYNGGVDSLAVTHLDFVPNRASWRIWFGGHYHYMNAFHEDVIRTIEDMTEHSVDYLSYGPTYKDKEVMSGQGLR